ncbi:MAG: hypothetical protein Q8874_01150 [Sweet potato little leaf phytoplasma]|nr:hypothetical protein [Sweet potato little leaf phytoplasma]
MILEIFCPFTETVCWSCKNQSFYIYQIGKISQVLNGYNKFFQYGYKHHWYKTKSFEKNIDFLDDLSLCLEIIEYYLIFHINIYFEETNNIKLKILKKYTNKEKFFLLWMKTKFNKVKNKLILFMKQNILRKIISFILTLISFQNINFLFLKKLLLLFFSKI